jgi:hypothetical protein
MVDIICNYSQILQQTTVANCNGGCGDHGKVDGCGELDPVDPWAMAVAMRESGILSLSADNHTFTNQSLRLRIGWPNYYFL